MEEFMPMATAFAKNHTLIVVAWVAVFIMVIFSFIINSLNLLPTEIKNHNIGKIEQHKDTPVILVCTNGVTSTTSAEILAKQGFNHVYTLKDGLAGWRAASLPLVRK